MKIKIYLNKFKISLKNNGVLLTLKKVVDKLKTRIFRKKSNIVVEKIEYDKYIKKFTDKLSIIIIVNQNDYKDSQLEKLILSIKKQTIDTSEIILGIISDDKYKINTNYDLKMKINYLDKETSYSDCVEKLLKKSSNDYVTILDSQICLKEDFVFHFLKEIDEKKCDILYSDEKIININGNRGIKKHYKQDFSLETLRSFNYIGETYLFKKSLLDKLGGYKSGYNGLERYDILFKLIELSNNVGHISRILYSNRSCKYYSDEKLYDCVLKGCMDIVKDHLKRSGISGEVIKIEQCPGYRVVYDIKDNPLVSIIIPTKDFMDDLKKCIHSVLTLSTYSNYEIIVVENNSEKKETFEYYKEIENHPKIKVVYYEGEFNYSKINNYGYEYITGEYIILLNNDIEILSKSWIEEMLMYVQKQDIGICGAKLYYPDETIQHAGVIIGINGVAGHSHKNIGRYETGYFKRLCLTQELSAVTAALLMIDRKVFEDVGKLDEEKFKVAFNDVDLCLQSVKHGKKVIFSPYVEAYHYESKSRGLDNDNGAKQKRFEGEVNNFYQRWDDKLKKGDPFYNINLSLKTEDFTLK
ncbi:MAG: glycosyltransferase [Oscillospiraceae bacterium]|nr:glycosyltransferase [Oscillospiraceae bacterium]